MPCITYSLWNQHTRVGVCGGRVRSASRGDQECPHRRACVPWGSYTPCLLFQVVAVQGMSYTRTINATASRLSQVWCPPKRTASSDTLSGVPVRSLALEQQQQQPLHCDHLEQQARSVRAPGTTSPAVGTLLVASRRRSDTAPTPPKRVCVFHKEPVMQGIHARPLIIKTIRFEWICLYFAARGGVSNPVRIQN